MLAQCDRSRHLRLFLAIVGFSVFGQFGHAHDRPALMRRIETSSQQDQLALLSDGSSESDSASGVAPDQGHAALLFIDGQNALRQRLGDDAISNIRLLSHAFKKRGFPVLRKVWRKGHWRSDGAPKDENQVLEPGSKDMHNESRFVWDHEWSSWHYDAFTGFSLDEHLRKSGVHTLILVGGFTETCISATAYHAHDLGYRVLVVDDAVESGGNAGALHTSSLKALSRAGVAEVSSTKAALSIYAFPPTADSEKHVMIPGLAADLEGNELDHFAMRAARFSQWHFFDQPRRLGLLIIQGSGHETISEVGVTDQERINIMMLEQMFHIWKLPVIRCGASEFPWRKDAESDSAAGSASPLMEMLHSDNAPNTLVLVGVPLWTGEMAAAAFAALDNNLDVVVATDAIALGASQTSGFTTGSLSGAEVVDDAMAVRADGVFVLTHSVAHAMTTAELLHPYFSALQACVSYGFSWDRRQMPGVSRARPNKGCAEVGALAYRRTEDVFGVSAADSLQAIVESAGDCWHVFLIYGYDFRHLSLLAPLFLILLWAFLREAMWRSAGKPCPKASCSKSSLEKPGK